MKTTMVYAPYDGEDVKFFDKDGWRATHFSLSEYRGGIYGSPAWLPRKEARKLVEVFQHIYSRGQDAALSEF